MKKELTDLQRHQVIRDFWDMVGQAAEFRYRIRWRGGRELFARRGYDPMAVIQLTCDHGNDVHGYFVLPDGNAISCDMLEDSGSKQVSSFSSWETVECSANDEDDFGLALQIISEPQLRDAFDRSVIAFYDFHWRGHDAPLPGGTA